MLWTDQCSDYDNVIEDCCDEIPLGSYEGMKRIMRLWSRCWK